MTLELNCWSCNAPMSANPCFDDAGDVAKATYEASVERTARALVDLRRKAEQ